MPELGITLYSEREKVKPPYPETIGYLQTRRNSLNSRPMKTTYGERYNEQQAKKALARGRRMARLYAKGLTMDEIGVRFGGISGARVGQLIRKVNGKKPLGRPKRGRRG